MAYAYNEYTGTVETDYLISFEGPTPGYLSEDHVIFYLNGVAQANSLRTFIDSTHVRIAAPLATDIVRFQRESSIDTSMIDWGAGAGISSGNLDTNTLQMLYLCQETLDDIDRCLQLPRLAIASVDTELPTPVANYAIGWDSLGTGLTNVATNTLYTVNFDTIQNYTDLATAVATIGSTPTTLLIDTACVISASLTIPATLHLFIVGGGSLVDDASNAYLTLRSSIIAGMNQVVFDWTNGTGEVIYEDGSVVSAEWHGSLVQALDDIYATSDVTLVVSRSEVMQANFTIGTNIVLQFINGAVLSDDANNATGFIYGDILAAPNQQIFNWGAGTGVLLYLEGTIANTAWHGGFAAAINDISDTTDITLQVNDSEVISTTLISPSSILLHFTNGSVLSDDASNADLTVLGSVLAGSGQEVFDWGNGSGTLTVTSNPENKAIQGSAVATPLVIRQVYLQIGDGAVADTIQVVGLAGFNGVAPGSETDIANETTKGNYTLYNVGTFILINNAGLGGNVLGVLSAQFFTSTGVALDCTVTPVGGSYNMALAVHPAGSSGSNSDLRALVDTGNILVFYITYITDA